METNSYTDALRRGQQQFADSLRAGQQAWGDAVEQLTTTWSQTVQHAPQGQSAVDPAVVIDQVFDFAVRMLEGQRQFAKNLVRMSAERLHPDNGTGTSTGPGMGTGTSTGPSPSTGTGTGTGTGTTA